MVFPLCLALALPLGACGRDAAEHTAVSGVTYTQALDAMNRQVADELERVVSEVAWYGLLQEDIVLCGHSKQQAATDDDVWVLARFSPAEETCAFVPLTLPPVAEDLPDIAAALSAQQSDPGQQAADERAYRTVSGVWTDTGEKLCLLLEDALLHYDHATDGLQVMVSQRALTICYVDAAGVLQPALRLQLPAEQKAFTDIAQVCFVDENGGLWLSASDINSGRTELLRFSLTDGSLQTVLPLPDGVLLQDCALQQGLLLALVRDNTADTARGAGNYTLFSADITKEAPVWRPAQVLPFSFSASLFVRFLPGASFTDKLTLYTDMGAFFWDMQQDTVQQWLDWSDFSLGSDLHTAFATAEGRCVVLTTKRQLRILTPLDPAALSRRTVLTFAVQDYSYMDAAKEIVNAFNAENTEYYIQLQDYTYQYAWEHGLTQSYDALLDQLTTDILRGEMPDILMLQQGSAVVNIHGAFLDLYPLLEADAELSLEDFLPNILAVTQQDGTLPTIIPAFGFRTLIGGARSGAQPGWTVDAYSAFCQENPSPVFATDKCALLSHTLAGGADQWIDWNTRQAHLDTPAFVTLLEACASQPDAAQVRALRDTLVDPKDLLQTDTELLLEMEIDGWSWVNTARYVFDDAYIFQGFPTPDGQAGGTILPELQLGIAANCRYSDVAWQLLRRFLMPEFQDQLGVQYTGFPLRRDSLAASAAAARSTPDVMGRITPWYLSGKMWNAETGETNAAMAAFMRQPLTDEGQTAILAVIDTLSPAGVQDGRWLEIVYEEATVFFAGQRSAEETAKIIQNRVQTYLDEQG